MTILELLKEDEITVKSDGTNKYKSPCPECGGTDRFQIWIDNNAGGNFHCRKCGIKGGTIKYLMIVRKMSYEQACLHIGKTPYSRGSIHNRKFPEASIEKEILPPEPLWQSKAIFLVEEAESNLWSGHHSEIIEWLNEKRGLANETIRDSRLGWLPEDKFYNRSDWGLPDKFKEDGKTKSKLWVPAGLLIPCFHDGQIQRIRIRKLKPQDGSRYYFISGSSTIPLVIGSGTYFVIVESELDAILLSQEAGDLARVIALGSADVMPYKGLLEMLNGADKILVSLDTDEAGARSSFKWWLSQFPNAIRWPVLKGKDPTEACINGLDLRDWTLTGIKYGKRIPTNSKTAVDNPPVQIFKLLEDNDSIVENLEKFKSAKAIALSIRNRGESPLLLMCSPDDPVIALDITTIRQRSLELLKEVLMSPAEKVLFDAKACLKVFNSFGIEVKGILFDVMIADQILNAGLDKKHISLRDLIDAHLPNGATGSDITETLFKIREILVRKLFQADLINTAKLEFECIKPTVQMELNGFCVDIDKVKAASKGYLPVKSEHEHKLIEELGEINLNNSDKVKEALAAIGIILENTKKETLLPLSGEHPVLYNILQYREISYDVTLAETVISKFNRDTGRIYPQYNQIGAPTGRSSSFEPNIHGIKKGEFRSFFISPPGHKLIIADYSQIELRIAAEISRDQNMLKAYNNGYDLHKLTASIITRKPIDQVTKEQRQAAKAVNFGLIYSMGAKGLIATARNDYGVVLSPDEAKLFRQRFFEFYKGIQEWHRRIYQSGARETRTIGGRRRIFESFEFTKLLNSPVQGTSADITKRALCLLSERLTGTEVKIIGCIHDEVILEAPESESDEVRDLLRSTMIEAGEYYLKSVPVEVEVSVVDNWMEK